VSSSEHVNMIPAPPRPQYSSFLQASLMSCLSLLRRIFMTCNYALQLVYLHIRVLTIAARSMAQSLPPNRCQ